MPLEDDVFPAEEQPLPAAVSPTTNSPGYITESDPKEDLEEEDDEDPEEDPTDYPADIDDDDDEELGTMGRAWITVQPQPPMTASTKALIDVVAATLPLPSPPPSPLISYSSPLPQIPSPPFLVPSYLLLALLTLRVVAPSTYCLAPSSRIPPSGTPSLLPIPLPTSSLPLLLPSTDYRVDVPEVTLPPRKRPTGGFRADYGFVSTLDAEIRRDPDKEIGYENTDVWVDPDEIAEEIPATDVAELAQSMDASDMTRSKMVALQSQQIPAKDPAHPDVPKEAGSSS
ncbi:hypothetical protein Tco_0154355 [Tanacetum coccineum]